MPTLTFIQPDGSQIRVQAQLGRSVMEAARDNQVRGVIAECGGACACSTCHCYVDANWVAHLPPMTDAEAGLVEFAWEANANSRLTCQLMVTAAFDGLVLQVPAQQL